MKNLTLDDLKQYLKLEPLTQEGGLIGYPYISDETIKEGTLENRIGDRPLCGTIYYVLTRNSFSRMHKLVTDEIWYYHAGPALKMLLIDENGKAEVKWLGMDIANGQTPQVTVKRNTWQGSMIGEDGEVTLVSTSMCPKYADSDYTNGYYDELKDLVNDDQLDMLKILTGEPVYE